MAVRSAYLGRNTADGVAGDRVVDLKLVKRKYANMMDLMADDDLLALLAAAGRR